MSRKRRAYYVALDVHLPHCPICGDPWKWEPIAAHGGGDSDAELTDRYDMAVCTKCGVRVSVDQPLEEVA